MAAKKSTKRKTINTISASLYQRDVPDADASLVAKDKLKDVTEIEVIKEVEKEVIKEVPTEIIKEVEVIREIPKEIIKEVEVIKEIEVIKEVPKEVIREVIKEVPKEIIKEVEVIKEVIKEVPVEVIKEVIKEVPVEVIKEVIKEVPIEKIETVLKTESFEEFIADFKSGYAGTNVEETKVEHLKIDENFNKNDEEIFQTSDDAVDFYLEDEDEEIDESQNITELETSEIEVKKVLKEEVKEEESKLQKLYKYHAKIRSFELYFKGVCVYSSLTYRVDIAFHKDFAIINGRTYRYADGLQMKFY